MCSGISIIGRIVIAILSLVFAIAGLGLLVMGILVKANSDLINSLLDTALQAAQAQAKNVAGTDLDTSNFNINELVGSLSIAFIVLGVVMLVIGVFGVVGACCMVKCMIQLYMAIIVILLVVQVILVVVIAGDRKLVTDPPKETLLSAFKKDYAGIEGKDTVSLLWNVIMNELQCCGIDGVSDITDAKNWKTSNEKSYVSPVACCKTDEFTGPASACVAAPDNKNSNIFTPCYEKIWDTAFQGIWFIIVALASLAFHTLLAIFSYAILQEIGSNKVGPV